ncbi:MAG: LptF/LptG family permease [Paludibacter sp.]|jgi:lipopolysaccharide export system permease protein|nr:LptF/LptG family permease [Paludibacter sp.]
MKILKRIDAYLIKRFIGLLIMTFVICVFILLMQFLWKHFDDLVGKGIGIGVIAEFFLYATAYCVPMALPLAILLASLMSFGNMGENFELTAMKSSGVSLFRIMLPLVIFVTLISTGAYYFSNNILPHTQAKLFTLIISLKQKSPELDVPSGEFYTGIGGVNIYVREKNNGLLCDLFIYDFSKGFNNATVTVADSGRIQVTDDKKFLLLSLYNGESFENFNNQQNYRNTQNIPYRREIFANKEILLDFDSEFQRYDESIVSDTHLSKNVNQLSHTIDSLQSTFNNRQSDLCRDMLNSRYLEKQYAPDSITNTDAERILAFSSDSSFLSLDQSNMETAITFALQKAREMKNNIEYNKLSLSESQNYLRRHQIEWHQKFTLSFACLIFFFIGAPLGAIIRKGGLGMPVVISVMMFIIYYIINNTGIKMAREGLWTPFEGMWLSSAVLLPIGIFLTYKAARDATLFRVEYYVKIIEKIKVFLKKQKK